MAGTSPDDVLKLLKCLATPQKGQAGHTNVVTLTSILEQNVNGVCKLLGENKYKNCIENLYKYTTNSVDCQSITVQQYLKLIDQESGGDLRWKYVLLTVNIMKMLNESQAVALERYNVLMQDMKNARPAETSAPPMSPDTLSVEQQKVFLTCLQFVVCLTILPALNAGVGMPLEKRSEFSELLQKDEKCLSLSEQELEWRLFYSLKSLLSLLDQPTLATLILTRNFGDVLAGLLQLCCASTIRRKRKTGTQEPNIQDNRRRITESDVEYCENEVKKLLEKIYPPLLVRELLVLQGGYKCGKCTLQRSPVWLRRVCGRLLCDMLIKPAGVQYVLKGLLHSPGEDGGADDWKRCESVSKVIANCPRQSLSVEQYYKAIGPQVVQLLHMDDRTVAQQYLRVALCSISTMVQQQLALTLKYVLQPVLEPLIRCTVYSDEQGSSVVVSEKQLERCVSDVRKVFTYSVCSAEQQSLLINALNRCIHVMFRLHCITFNSVVHLRVFVEEILLTYLQQAEVRTAVECIKLCVFEDVLQTSRNNGLRFPLMCNNVCFVPGPGGGAIAMRTANVEPGNWEGRCNAVVDLLSRLQKDGLSADFFIYLLQQLTAILSEELEPSRHQQDSQSNRLEVDDGEAKLTRNLILLSLLASMCEKLGHTCFKSAKHILQFVQATLERGVKVLENTDDAELGIFGSETVTMAMGLLTAVLSGASEVSQEDRERTKDVLPLLNKLSREHPDSTVKEMATDLRIAIATHGFVMSDVLNKANTELQQTFDQTKSKADSAINESMNNMKSAKLKQAQHPKTSVVSNDCSVQSNGPDVKPKKRNNAPANHVLNPVLEPSDSMNSWMDLISNSVADVNIDSALDEVLSDEKEIKKTDCKINKKSLIEVIASSEEADSLVEDSSLSDNNRVNGHDVTVSDSAYRGDYKPGKVEPHSTSPVEQAFKELLDPLIPVRGHALISLRRLLENKHPDVMQKQDILFKIFYENLDHSDTYIYLSAVQGLAVLADRLPQKVVPILAREYANFDQLNVKVKLGSMLRLKLGEVLMKTTRGLGDTAPAYRDVLLRSILHATKDEDRVVRASAMSNLAELCKLLRFALGNVLFEVFECVSSLLKTDPHPEVRQAAAMFTTMLLHGLGSDSFKVLGGCMRELYRLLKHSIRAEKNESVKVHMIVTLQELDQIMHQFLFPEQILEKRIGVLESPDVDLGFK